MAAVACIVDSHLAAVVKVAQQALLHVLLHIAAQLLGTWFLWPMSKVVSRQLARGSDDLTAHVAETEHAAAHAKPAQVALDRVRQVGLAARRQANSRDEDLATG